MKNKKQIPPMPGSTICLACGEDWGDQDFWCEPGLCLNCCSCANSMAARSDCGRYFKKYVPNKNSTDNEEELPF